MARQRNSYLRRLVAICRASCLSLPLAALGLNVSLPTLHLETGPFAIIRLKLTRASSPTKLTTGQTITLKSSLAGKFFKLRSNVIAYRCDRACGYGTNVAEAKNK